MTANDFEIFFLTTITGTASLGIVFYVYRTLLVFMRQTETDRDRQRRAVTNAPADRPGIAVERRGATNVPTITCSLPIPTQGREQQRLW